MKKITVMTPCYNEEGNIEDLYLRVKEVFNQLPNYEYEHLFIDNASQDQTVDELKKIAQKDPRVKVIVNARNFGPVRSSYHGILQCYGDAVIPIVADLQDPPELILEFIQGKNVPLYYLSDQNVPYVRNESLNVAFNLYIAKLTEINSYSKDHLMGNLSI